LSLGCEPAQISFAAPLTFDGFIEAGTLVYNDLFTIYPYENQLFVVRMSGKEIKDYLEYSYDLWINTIDSQDDHLLKIKDAPDPRTGMKHWSFINRSYNFDSAGGLVYKVDVTKPKGERVMIESLADGSAFDESASYNVAMTSYRASGGGNIMREGAGVDTDRIDERVVAYHPEIRDILYDYLVVTKEIDPATVGDRTVIGEWSFVPESLASKAMDRDIALLFDRR
jgi:2',3'-cyclic-nucleotide 2'-phosphodiesterase/3'-nucleotidase